MDISNLSCVAFDVILASRNNSCNVAAIAPSTGKISTVTQSFGANNTSIFFFTIAEGKVFVSCIKFSQTKDKPPAIDTAEDGL